MKQRLSAILLSAAFLSITLLWAFDTRTNAGDIQLEKSAAAGDAQLEKYVEQFTYEARKEMKIDSANLISLLKKHEVQFIDIRFPEEYEAWKVGPSKSIPLNQLPSRLDEIDRNKIVVTACPHKDRAIIAMVYLRSKGIKAKYLTDGLIGLAEELRGDNAKIFIESINPDEINH